MAYIDTPESQAANRRFIKEAMRAPLLEADHELDLARAWREEGDEDALHELTQAYMRLVVSLATRFRNYGLPFGDLIQEGNIGLMQAAARFEPEREVRFSTYASWWIRSAIQDYVLRNWSIVRTGTTAAQKSLFFNLRRLRAKIDDPSASHMSHDKREEIARQLGVNVSDVEHMEGRMAASDRSLNAPLVDEDGGAEWQDVLPDEGPTPDEWVADSYDQDKRKQWIARAMENLNDRESMIIRERRLTDDGVTLESLGAKLGISKERVRQIEHAALTKMKKAMLADVPDPIEAGLVA